MPEIERLAAERNLPVFQSTDAADLRRLARQALATKVDRIVVAGGDGTLHHVAQELVGLECALGVLPFGSGNDFARVLGIPRVPAAALDIALQSTPWICDVARVGDRFVLGIISAGLDSIANKFANDRIRHLPGTASYVYAAIHTLVRFEPLRATLRHDNGEYSGDVMSISAANSRQYGGGMKIAPAAVLDDGLLDVVIIKKVGKFEYLRSAPSVFSGSHLSHPAVCSFRSSRIELSIEGSAPLVGDGEFLCMTAITPIVVDMVPRALNIAAPRPPQESA